MQRVCGFDSHGFEMSSDFKVKDDDGIQTIEIGMQLSTRYSETCFILIISGSYLHLSNLLFIT